MDYLIIGGGIAATSALKAIRANDPDADIAIVSDENPSFYHRPLIPLLIDGSRSIKEIAFTFNPLETYKAGFIQGRVDSLMTDKKVVILASGKEVSYKRLLIASGSSPFLPPIEGIRGEGVYTLRGANDAIKIRSHALKSRSVAIIGGGFVGVKAAEALQRFGLRVIIIEQLPQLLFPKTDIVASEIISGRLNQSGIEILPSEKVEEILRKDDSVSGVRLGSGRTVDADMVVVATGVRPNVEFLKSSEIKVENGVVVNENLQTTSSDVYAAGDVVQYRELIEGRDAVSALWSNAAEMGRIAGTNMAGGKLGYEGFLSVMNASDIESLPFISVGIVDDRKGKYEIFSERKGDNYRKLIFKEDRLVGALFLGNIQRAGIYTNLIKNRISLGSLKITAIKGTLNYGNFIHPI